MPGLNQKGVIVQLVIFLLLAVGIGVGIYLVQQKTNILPKAGDFRPAAPESSYALDAPRTETLGSQFKVTVNVRSDIDAANLFAVKLKFPTDLLEVKSIKVSGMGDVICQVRPACLDEKPRSCEIPEPTEGWCPEPLPPVLGDRVCGGVSGQSCPEGFACAIITTQYPAQGSCVKINDGVVSEQASSKSEKEKTDIAGKPLVDSFIKNWVEKIYDNNVGTISLVGGVPNPGYKTKKKNPPSTMAVIIFAAKKTGTAIISFADGSAIYRNSDNLDILATKKDVEVNIGTEVEPSVTTLPLPSGTPVSISDCKSRPACLSENPPCSMSEPIEGWCPVPPPGPPQKGDINGDGKIGLIDMSSLLSKWGKKNKNVGKADLNGDKVVNTMDYSLMIKILIENGVIKGASDLSIKPKTPN